VIFEEFGNPAISGYQTYTSSKIQDGGEAEVYTPWSPSSSDFCTYCTLGRFLVHNVHVQCESKNPPWGLCDNFFIAVGNFSPKFYTPITRSYVRWKSNFI